jgi:hypothetical protein
VIECPGGSDPAGVNHFPTRLGQGTANGKPGRTTPPSATWDTQGAALRQHRMAQRGLSFLPRSYSLRSVSIIGTIPSTVICKVFMEWVRAGGGFPRHSTFKARTDGNEHPVCFQPFSRQPIMTSGTCRHPTALATTSFSPSICQGI